MEGPAPASGGRLSPHVAPGSTELCPLCMNTDTCSLIQLPLSNAWESRPFFSSSEGHLVTKENSVSVNPLAQVQEGERQEIKAKRSRALSSIPPPRLSCVHSGNADWLP